MNVRSRLTHDGAKRLSTPRKKRKRSALANDRSGYGKESTNVNTRIRGTRRKIDRSCPASENDSNSESDRTTEIDHVVPRSGGSDVAIDYWRNGSRNLGADQDASSDAEDFEIEEPDTDQKKDEGGEAGDVERGREVDTANESEDGIDGKTETITDTTGTTNVNFDKSKKETHDGDLPTSGDRTASFEELGVCKELCIACKNMGWTRPTAIQTAVIPTALQGRDIIALAQTGSGKTAAFVLPILQNALIYTHGPQATPRKLNTLYALVLSPTRELCIQIAEQFVSIGAIISLKVATLVGGVDMATQTLLLSRQPHVCVGSPGRVCDHLQNSKGFSLSHTQYFVLDEADRLLTLDFEETITTVLQLLPPRHTTYLFSATMTSKVSKLQRISLRNPAKVSVDTKYTTTSGLVQHFLLVPFKYKATYLAKLCSHFNTLSTMIFANTCVTSTRMAVFLRILGFEAVCLHGKMTQPQRLGALNKFKAGKFRILVATEVASRGLDISHVDAVLIYDVPLSSKDYIHRVGRTARAGRGGRAITIVTQYDIELYQRVEHALGKKLEEFKEIRNPEVMAMHERCLEALRNAEMEMKEKEHYGEKFKGRKKFGSFKKGKISK